jgi:hypothetical protein
MSREGLTDDLRKLKLNVIKRILSEHKKELELNKLADKYKIPTWEIVIELDTIRL